MQPLKTAVSPSSASTIGWGAGGGGGGAARRTVPEGHPAGAPRALPVGPAGNQDVDHPADRRGVGEGAVEGQLAREAAHEAWSFPRSGKVCPTERDLIRPAVLAGAV